MLFEIRSFLFRAELSEATKQIARKTGRDIKVVGNLDGGSANEKVKYEAHEAPG